jgi:quinol monooxygenase YgiN
MEKLRLLGLLAIVTISGTNVCAEPIWLGSAILIVKPSKINEFKTAVSKIIKPTRAEPGCITYEGFQILDEKGNETNRFEFREVWNSKKTMLIDHKEKAPHMREFFKTLKIGAPDSYLESFTVDGKSAKKLN